MSNNCVCTGTYSFQDVQNCSACSDLCGSVGQNQISCSPSPQKVGTVVLGVSLTVFLVILAIQIALLIFMIWFSIHVMRKCKGKPKWLNPTVIALLVIWILIGWFPGIGFLDFIVLLVILIIYNNKCKK